MKETDHAPENWVRCSLSDIVVLNPKNDASAEQMAGFVPMALAPTDYHGALQHEEKLWGEIKKSYTNFADGDVIFAKVTPCFENGKAAIVRDMPSGIGAGSSEFYVLRPASKEISPSLLFAIIKTQSFMQQGAENMTGAVGLRRVPRAFVESFPIALPPAAEQKVIADKLDTLLAQVENAKARLERIPQILKRFRQSVLAAAVSGRLTEEWRSEHAIPDNSWVVKAASGLCEKVQSGSTPKNNPFDQNGTVPFLKVYNIVNQEIDFGYRPQFITEEVHQTKLKRSIGYPRDVLMNIVGPPLGKVAILPDTYPEWNLNQAITLFRPDPQKLLPKFLFYVLCEGSMVRDVTHDLKGIVGQVNISLTQCREAKIPCPILPEQTEIVRRVDQLFAHADCIEQQVNNALARVNNLTQSILAKALRGELTEQWRKDNAELISGVNSAAALLEKIKAERKAQKPTGVIRARKIP
ncbi:MAG: restriction endonuclease subunit S [Anaerolineaceae bacterium]|nr:restriction endonuclease subunit S [Anaerolineaceae bacterium]